MESNLLTKLRLRYKNAESRNWLLLGSQSAYINNYAREIRQTCHSGNLHPKYMYGYTFADANSEFLNSNSYQIVKEFFFCSSLPSDNSHKEKKETGLTACY